MKISLPLLLLLIGFACKTNTNSTPADDGAEATAVQTRLNGDNHLFDFSENTSTATWNIVDDTVMGGRSEGNFTVTNEGHGRFYGKVSLENNGGFSSIRHRFDAPKALGNTSAFRLRVKGDGSDYGLRIKDQSGQRYVYAANFSTTGDWQVVEVPYTNLAAQFRGYDMSDRVPPFSAEQVLELQLLIGNKRAQAFDLLVDWIGVE